MIFIIVSLEDSFLTPKDALKSSISRFAAHFFRDEFRLVKMPENEKRAMSKFETLLADGLQSEIFLQLHLKAMRKALGRQLQETKMRQTEELEKRIHQNSLLLTNGDGNSTDEEDLNHKPRFVGMRSSTSVSALTSDKTSNKQRPKTSSLACSLNLKHRSSMAQPCERYASSKTTQQSKDEEDEAECKKKFSAAPVPGHVIQPIYCKMMELRGKERKQGCEQRKMFLLSTQKPFSFEEREKNKKETLMNTLNHVPQLPGNSICTKAHKHMKDSNELNDQEDVCRKVHTRVTTRQRNSAQAHGPEIRSADLTRKKKLDFLNEKPSFQPKIIQKVPDFSRLHKALQTEALNKMASKDVTKCQPFVLRTSALPVRKRKESPETSQVPKFSHLGRSRSLGALTLIPADTLPTFITDAVRQRHAAIRKSMELRESKNQETADWSRSYQMRSQAMKKSVALHAKFQDPHRSLKDVFHENLKRHLEADQRRMREYMRELHDMKARVSQRPFLFEQVKQKSAKARAEQIYRSKLQDAGLKEKFVEESGELFRSDDDTETNDSGTEDEHQIREENVDDVEKIEDVEEKSVKSRGEETL